MTDLRDRPVSLAVQLLRHGGRFAVAGSTARWVVTGVGSPRDLDVVVDAADLPRLGTALAALGVHSRADVLARAGQSHVDTPWGPLDVFIDRVPWSLEVPVELASGPVLVPVVAP